MGRMTIGSAQALGNWFHPPKDGRHKPQPNKPSTPVTQAEAKHRVTATHPFPHPQGEKKKKSVLRLRRCLYSYKRQNLFSLNGRKYKPNDKDNTITMQIQYYLHCHLNTHRFLVRKNFSPTYLYNLCFQRSDYLLLIYNIYEIGLKLLKRTLK